MSTQQGLNSLDKVSRDLRRAVGSQNLAAIAEAVSPLSTAEAIRVLERFGATQRALVYRMLPKDTALEVFEGLDRPLQGDLVRALRDEDVAAVFAEMNPDDRVGLLDELPASVATRLLRGLSASEQEITAAVLGYPVQSIGRRMSPKFLTVHPHDTADRALEQVRTRMGDAETVYTLPVVDEGRRLVGITSLRQLMQAEPRTPVGHFLRPAHSVEATVNAEEAARRCADLKLLAVPVVDAEGRLVGILTVDDALRILEDADSEDQARLGGSEPLRRPYLSTPVRALVRSRAIWCWPSGPP